MKKTPLILMAGHYYKRRNGDIIGPLARNKNHVNAEGYPFEFAGSLYTIDGYYVSYHPNSELNLIEEVGGDQMTDWTRFMECGHPRIPADWTIFNNDRPLGDLTPIQQAEFKSHNGAVLYWLNGEWVPGIFIDWQDDVAYRAVRSEPKPDSSQNSVAGILMQGGQSTITIAGKTVNILPAKPRGDQPASDTTIREAYAMAALQGMLSHAKRYKPRLGASKNWHEAITEEAGEIAEALLAALEQSRD
jgi:hypothetical protein